MSVTLIVACSRDKKPEANPEPSPSPTAEVTEPSLGRRVSVSAPQPFTLVPLSKTPEAWPIDRSIWGVLVYDSATGEVTVAAEAGDGAFWLGWLNETELVVRIENSVALYNAALRSYRTFDLGLDLYPNSDAVPSPDGSMVAIDVGGGNLVLADMRSMTFRELSMEVDPEGMELDPQEWSPDSARLLVKLLGSGDHFVIELARPDRPILLPEASLYTGWLSATKLFGTGRGGARLVDVRAPDRPVPLPDIPVHTHFSPDGTYLAVTETRFEDEADYRTLMADTAVYRLEPFELIAEFDHTALCCTQTRQIWTSDSTRFVALRNLCVEGESLVMVNFRAGSETVLAQAGTSQAAVSPDDKSVAFAHGGWLSIVPADGSAAPRAISQRPLGYPAASLQWSRDGRFLAFTIGGYDRCP